MDVSASGQHVSDKVFTSLCNASRPRHSFKAEAMSKLLPLLFSAKGAVTTFA